MKTYLSLWITLLVSVSILAQWDKVETYQTGTKITFYKNACGTTVPNTVNKLTFCDNNNNLGVVEASYGLNNRSIKTVVENHFNDDLVFLTPDGFSIQKEDGTWRNIPKYALPRHSLTSSPPSVTEAIVHTDGKLYYYHGNTFGLHWVDITTMETGMDDIGYFYVNHFTSDLQNDVLYGFRTNKIFKKTSNGTISTHEVSNLSAITVKDMIVYGDDMFIVTNNSILQIDLNNFSIVNEFTSSDLGITGQIQSANPDDNDILWLAISGSYNEGGLLQFDMQTHTSNLIQIDRPGTGYIGFKAIAHLQNGDVLGLGSNYGGYVTLHTDNNGVQQTELTTLEDLENNYGFDLIYNFNDVALQNDQLIFAGSSASTSVNDADEVVIHDLSSDQWHSINDNEPGNISHRMIRRTTKNAYPATDGVWWANAHDRVIVKTNNDDTFYEQINTSHLISSGIIVDADDAPVFSNRYVHKLYPPAIFELTPPDRLYSYVMIRRYKDQIWAWDSSQRHMAIYRNNQFVGSYDVDGLPSGYYGFEVDTNRHAWFVKQENNNTLNVFEFNPDNLSTTTHTFNTTAYLGVFKKIIAGNQYVAFVFSNSVIAYDGTNFVQFDSSDAPMIAQLVDAVTDVDGGLHILRENPSAIISIDNVSSNAPNVEVLNINRDSGIVPYVQMTSPNALVLDYDGHFWTHGSSTWMKIDLESSVEPYLPDGTTHGIHGMVYLDNNENDVYDDGEAYANQKVTMVEGDYQVTSFTDNDGEFFFMPNTIGAKHRVTLSSFSPYIMPARVQATSTVANADEDIDLGEFELEPMNVEGLMVKSSDKPGLWGFTREGFENAFTTAIGNISNVRTFNDLLIEYKFKNEGGNSFDLPTIAGVEVYKITPNNSFPIIQNVQIEPRSNRWSISVSPSTYTQSLQTISPDIVYTPSEIKVGLTLPQIQPYETYIIKINTGTFLPQSNGEVVGHGVSKVGGPDLGGTENNPQPQSFDLFPRNDDPDVDTPNNFNNYPNPYNDDDSPYIPRKKIYAPKPYKSSVYSSYDPNDKLVSPGLPDELNQQHIEEKWLNYTINFENKGNFSAKDVAIIDTLDVSLNPDTFVMYESSHPVNTKFIPWENRTIVKFDFKDIYLDYTDNDPIASRGYVKYWIRASDDIAEGTIVENSAAIYFDQNPPIYTNVTQNKFLTLNMSTDDFVDSDGLKVRYYPNPVEDILNLSFPDNHHYDLKLYDLTGQILIEEELTNNKDYRLNLSALKAGLYILNIVNDQGEFVSYKIMKK